MELGHRLGRVATRAWMAGAVACALALGSGSALIVVGDGPGATGAEQREDETPSPGAVRSSAEGTRQAAGEVTTTVAPPTDGVAPGSVAGTSGTGSGGTTDGGTAGDPTCITVTDYGSCVPSSVPVPAPSDYDGIPGYPGRYQVDPATGQIVDTGSASMPPTEVIRPPVAPTAPPPPPVIHPAPPSTSPPAPTTTTTTTPVSTP